MFASASTSREAEPDFFLQSKNRFHERNPGVLECYELLSLHYLEQFQDEETWQKLIQWYDGTLTSLKVIVNLPKELWFVAIFLNENPGKLRQFLEKCKRQHIGEEEHLLSSYLKSSNLTELYLDTTFRSSEVSTGGNDHHTSDQTLHQFIDSKPPVCIFRCCPNIKILSLKSNNLEIIPPDIGRLSQLEKLYLTNNRLQNGSIPYTLEFCTKLEELYLDDNLLDALPSILLRIPSLKKVHRHGNHNYFKSTFMWYHTDVTGRILPTNPAQEDVRHMLPPVTFEPINLQNMCSKAIIASRVNFYSAEIPYRLKIHIGEMINYVNLCEKCNGVKNISESGFKVFTFKNPYLGNTCVPFLHWTCDYECAQLIEIPARSEQILSAIQQDKMYEEYVRQAVDLMPMTTRSLSNLNIPASPLVVESVQEISDDSEVDQIVKQAASMNCQIV